MPRQLRFTFVDRGISGLVDFYEEFAPKTCETIWSALASPIRVPAIHAIYSGPEIMSAQSFDPRSIPNENQTVIPAPGDVLWFYQAPNLMKGLTDEFWEIGLFYGDGGRIFGPMGWLPVNFFARMRQEDLPAFAAECRDIRISGAKVLEIARL